MSDFNSLLDFLLSLLPTVVLSAVLLAGLWFAHKAIIQPHAKKGNERLLSRQLAMLLLTIISLVIIVLVLPVSDSTRNQILTLVGIVLSGIIAFSSTTVVSNIMAGFMLRVTKPFATGDFIYIGEHTGRVVERGLLDTEIQTEDRELVSLPNIYVASNPVCVVHKDGAMISSKISLGYDISHSTVEEILIKAVEKTGLEGAFVQIISLGDFSIEYKVSGLLLDTKTLLSSRTELHRNILCGFRDAEIEIVSPTFMNQRVLPAEVKTIPEKEQPKLVSVQADLEPVIAPEKLVFDKAEFATMLEEEKQRYKDRIKAIEAEIAETSDADEKKRLKSKIDFYKQRIAKLKDSTEA